MGILAAADNVAAALGNLAQRARAAAAAARPQPGENLAALSYRADQWQVQAAALAQGYPPASAAALETFTLAEQLRNRAQAAAEEAAAVAAQLQAQGDNAGAARAIDLAQEALALEADAFEAMQRIHAAEVLARDAAQDLVNAGREILAGLAGAQAAAATAAERQAAADKRTWLQREIDGMIADLLGAVAGPVTAAAGFAAVAALAIVGLFLIRPAARAARRALK